jgi:replicative DNA helicase
LIRLAPGEGLPAAQDDKPVSALGRLSGTMQLCQMLIERNRVVDLAQESLSVVKGEYVLRKSGGDDYGLKFGWPTLDNMTGGLMGGDLITIVGRPGAGKTYLMMHGANTAWRSGKIPLFVSMEMKPLQIMQRASAMLARFPITGIKHATLETKQETALWKKLAELKKSNFPYWVIDGALTSTVDDIIMLTKQLNPSAVYVDGAYLLRGGSFKQSRWERLTENAERLKGEVAEAMNIPVCLSYQFNREVKKGAKPQSVGLENIAYTDALGQLSSVVLGMLQDQGTETLTQRRIEILKGRNGEEGNFLINWRFDQGPDYMNFAEILPPSEASEQEDELHYV